MTRFSARFFLPLAAILAIGCGSTHTEEDAAIMLDDSGPRDAGVDGGPNLVGEACRDDGDCPGENATCVTELPGGYCSAFCNTSDECGPGSVCLDFGNGTQLCTASCDPTAADQCRPGYGCAGDIGSPVCLPGCEDDTDCDAGFECDPTGGGFSGGAGQCFTPGSSLGDACQMTEQCPSGGFCFPEQQSGLPGGYCSAFGCDPATNTGCGEGGVCLPGGRGGRCYLGCEAPEDCAREGYTCTESNDTMACLPEFDPSSLGQICSAGRGSCFGACLSEGQTGWPDSYCVDVGCTIGGDDCPGDGVCTEAGDSTICLDGCATGGDCRDGYDCVPSNPEEPTSALACRPGCDDATVCGNEGFECNLGTGLCTEPFVDANLGEPCVGVQGDGSTDCPGGRCLDEADDGHPAGMCVLGGCRLTGDGPMTACPSGSACIDDDSGSPELGVCAPSCTTETSTCRPGYACEPFEVDGTDGACTPSCETDSCGGGRTCDTNTGLCS